MNSLFPIINLDFTPFTLHYIFALILGILFGFVLENSGFGRATILASQFYFYNMRVFKVMFTAIITAMVGLSFFIALGLVDMSQIYIPETFILPHIIGGLIFGIGFIMAGYCPGTSIVGTASGNWDSLLTFLGVITGSIFFGEIYPSIEKFYHSTAKGVYTLDKAFGISFNLLALIIPIFAIILFFGAEKLENIFSKKFSKPFTPYLKGSSVKLLSLLIIIALFSVFVKVSPTIEPISAKNITTKISPVKLAQLIIEAPSSFYLIDLRPENLCKSKHTIPNSICFEVIKKDIPNIPETKSLIFFAQSDIENLPEEAYSFKGNMYILKGGYQLWKALIVDADKSKLNLIPKNERDENLLLALHSYFTGSQLKVITRKKPPKIIKRAKHKKSGGC